MRCAFAFATACAWERSFFAPSAPAQTFVAAPAAAGPYRLAPPPAAGSLAPPSATPGAAVWGSYLAAGAAAAVAVRGLSTRRVSAAGVRMSLNVPSPYEGAKFSWSQPGEAGVWDPLKLLTSEEKFERLRYVEVKHGRVAMLAVLGHVLAATGWRFPGELYNGVKFADIPGSGFAALSKLAPADLATIFFSVGFLELRVMKEQVKGEFPGDLRNGLFKEGWDGLPDSVKKQKINIELNNGRAAMMGIMGLMVHEMLDGKPYILNEMLGWGQPY